MVGRVVALLACFALTSLAGCVDDIEFVASAMEHYDKAHAMAEAAIGPAYLVEIEGWEGNQHHYTDVVQDDRVGDGLASSWHYIFAGESQMYAVQYVGGDGLHEVQTWTDDTSSETPLTWSLDSDDAAAIAGTVLDMDVFESGIDWSLGTYEKSLQEEGTCWGLMRWVHEAPESICIDANDGTILEFSERSGGGSWMVEQRQPINPVSTLNLRHIADAGDYVTITGTGTLLAAASPHRITISLDGEPIVAETMRQQSWEFTYDFEVEDAVAVEVTVEGEAGSAHMQMQGTH